MALHEGYEGNFGHLPKESKPAVSDTEANRKRFLKNELRNLGFKGARVRKGSKWMSFRYRKLIVRVKVEHVFSEDNASLNATICRAPMSESDKDLFERLYKVWEQPSYVDWIDNRTKASVRLSAALGHVDFKLKSQQKSYQPDDARKILARQVKFLSDDYANQCKGLYP
jgi:hypothetical protein